MTKNIGSELEALLKFVNGKIGGDKEINTYHGLASIIQHENAYEIVIPIGTSASKKMMNELKYQQLKKEIDTYCNINKDILPYRVSDLDSDPIIEKRDTDFLPTLYIKLEYLNP